MRIIDKTPFQAKDGTISLFNRLQGAMQFGASWYKDMQAQQAVITLLQRYLDNSYALLRNITIPGSGVPIPFILAGPAGLWVLYVSSLRGVYRAKDDSWMSMEGGRFKVVRPNLISRVKLMARAVEAHLAKESVQAPEVKTALLFIDPGLHVDSVHPSVRVVLSDALDRFAAGIIQESGALKYLQIRAILNSLSNQDMDQLELAASTEEDKRDFFSRAEAEEEKPPRQAPGVLAQAEEAQPSFLEKAAGRIQLTRQQWLLLGLFFGVEVLLLIAFLLVLLFVPF
jgi:hypothetical protein